MTAPTAAAAIAAWQSALREQREAERHLEEALDIRSPEWLECALRVDTLRTRADLLLAEAARIQALARMRGESSAPADAGPGLRVDLDLPPDSFSAD